jgi:hypothetical protein
MDKNKKDNDVLYIDVDDFFKNKKIDVNIEGINDKKDGEKHDDRKKNQKQK